MKRSAARHAAHTEYVHLLLFAIDLGPGFVPIHLPFLTPAITLRHEYLAVLQAQLDLSHAHILSHRRLGDIRTRMFLLQARPDPMRGMPLFSRRFPVRLQHTVNPATHCTQLRPFSMWF